MSIDDEWTAIAAHLRNVHNVVGLEGGINNIGAGDDGPTTFGKYQTLAQRIVSNLDPLSGGPHDLFSFTISYGGVASQAKIDACNGLIRGAFAGWATSNVHVHLVDFGADPMLGTVAGSTDSGNFNYFQDGSANVHGAKTWHERAAALYAAQLLAAGL